MKTPAPKCQSHIARFTVIVDYGVMKVTITRSNEFIHNDNDYCDRNEINREVVKAEINFNSTTVGNVDAEKPVSLQKLYQVYLARQ